MSFDSLAGKTITVSIGLTNGEVYTATGTVASEEYSSSSSICSVHIPLNGSNYIVGFNYSIVVKRYYFDVWIPADSISMIDNIAYFKLELGPVATPFVPPNPAVELAKCQRYFYAVPYGRDRFVGNVTTDGVGLVLLPLPTTMRTTPTVLNSDGSEIKMQATNGDSSILSDIIIAQVTPSPVGIMLALNSSNFTKGQAIVAYHQRTEDSSALSMFISADL